MAREFTKCRQCFKSSTGHFDSGECEIKFNREHFGDTINDDLGSYPKESEWVHTSPSLDDLNKGLDKLDKFGNIISAVPTTEERRNALPNMEEMNAGKVLYN